MNGNDWDEWAEEVMAMREMSEGPTTKKQKTLPQAWKEMGLCTKCGDEGEQRGMSWHCQEHGLMYGI